MESAPGAHQPSKHTCASPTATPPPTSLPNTDAGAQPGCSGNRKGMACVPAGPFKRGVARDAHRCRQAGQPPDGEAAFVPTATIWLDAFFIDLTEVTNAAYRRCVADGKCADARPIYSDFDRPQQPITGLSWHHAERFCRAVNKRLPTEAQWEKAARGSSGEAYPWGKAPASCATAVIEDGRGRSCGVARDGGTGDTGRVLAVGSRPAGRYGLLDMIGNAEEWVADWWSAASACGQACAGRNPKGPCGGAAHCPGHQHRVVRGGSWYWPAEHATGYHRRRALPANPREAYHHFGFRCAADGR